MSEELKPCLRCGKENPHVFVNFGRDWVVKCVDGCAFSMDGYKTKEAAIHQWNFRPLEDRRIAEIERLRDALEFYANKANWKGGWVFSNGSATMLIDADGFIPARAALDGGK